jgi:hypothetical protein
LVHRLVPRSDSVSLLSMYLSGEFIPHDVQSMSLIAGSDAPG